jgi:hypothetical protein
VASLLGRAVRRLRLHACGLRARQNTLLFVADGAETPLLRNHYGYGRCPARVHPSIFLPYAGGRYHALRRRASAVRHNLPGARR